VSDDRRTAAGASLRSDVERVLDRLRRGEDDPQRLVLPEGASAVFRVAAVHERGQIGATVGYAKVTKTGVRVDASVTTAISEGRAVRTTGQLVITF
jgi:hypothetical protein